MYHLTDARLRLFGIPLCTVVVALVTRAWEPSLFEIPLVNQFIFTFLEILIAWHVCREILNWSRVQFPGTARMSLRIGIAYLLYALANVLTLLALLSIGHVHSWFEPTQVGSYVAKNMAISMGFIALSAAMYEAQYYFEQWLKAMRENEHLKQDTLRAQLDSFKLQVRPDFLFAGLDAVNGQVRQKNHAAASMVDSMADLYRYMLQSRNRSVVSLGQDLEHLQSYFGLLEKQHGKAVSLRVALPYHLKEKQIPPMSLQHLVETLLKHNPVSSDNPLIFNLFLETDHLIALHLHYRNPKTEGEKNRLVIPIGELRLPGYPEPQIRKTDTGLKLVLPLV